MQKSTPERDKAPTAATVEALKWHQTKARKGTDMNTNVTKEGAQLAAVTELMEEIAQIAARSDKLCRVISADDFDEAEALIGMLRDSINRIGWLADRGVGEANAAQIVGGADDWMLPPLVAARIRMAHAEAH